MNNGLRSLLIFSIGAAIGSLVTRQLLKDKYEAIVQEEIESVKEVYGREGHLKEPDREVDRDGDAVNPEEFMPDMEEKRRYKKTVKKYVPYNLITSNEEEKEDDSTTPEYPPPYVISIEQFDNDHIEYDKLSISYYEIDDVLADEHDEVIQNVTEIIGEGLLCFGDQSDDPDVVYVRNKRLDIDYEVVRLHKSYQEAVLGIKIVDERGVPIKTARRRLNEDNG